MEPELSIIGKVILCFVGGFFVLVLILGGDIISAIVFGFIGGLIAIMIMNVLAGIGILLFK